MALTSSHETAGKTDGAALQRRGARDPALCDRHAADRQRADRTLVSGSALFGIGWGLGGLCPGPAISSLLLAPGDAMLFVLMMLAGLAVGRMLTSGPAATPAAQA